MPVVPEEHIEETVVTEETPKYREVTMNVSAYTASDDECGKSDGITASGVVAVEGVTIAADDLPFGTVVEIQGKYYVVQDRFGGNHRNRIDIFMVSRSSALHFGRQSITVKIKEE
jgi:3D (Asp-Asp-Asp) domain-containing protein